MDETNYTYNGKYEGNVLIVGRTSCGKITFVQNLGKNTLFGDVKEVYWISKIDFPKIERTISETALLIRLLNLTILTM